MNNQVIIKGKKDRLEINLSSDVEFPVLLEILENKIKEAKNFIGKSNLAIGFSGRTLSTDEENNLIKVITDNSDITIAYVFSTINSSSENLIDRLPIDNNDKVCFHRANLRSGAKLEFDGHIVVIGDVNPGAVIRAKGSVIVIGHLNGNVYAGLGGEDSNFVGALFFNPIQVTIGMKTLSGIQKEILDSNRVNKSGKFKFAHIKNQDIIIEEWI